MRAQLLLVSFFHLNKLPYLNALVVFNHIFSPVPLGRGVIGQLRGHLAPTQAETTAMEPVSSPNGTVLPAWTYCRETLASWPSGVL